MSDQVGASHILVMHKESDRSSATRTKEQALELINEIKGKLDGGAEFTDLASENSDCPSGKDGGSLGSFSRGQMVKPFEDSAFGLGVDETSDVVETDFGYHLIRRDA